MKRYLVSFTTNTPICIRSLPALEDTKEPKIFCTELHSTNEEIVIQIYDNVVKYDSFMGRNGLRIEVALDSPDIVSSVDKAGGYADAMLSFLVLCTSSYAPVVKFDFAYEITPGVDKHKYMRDFYLEDIQPLIHRRAKPNIYGEIFRAAADHENRMQGITTKGEWHKYAGLQRAIGWFRKGIGADDIVDEYICYWIALEALDHLLPRDITELPRAKCAKCERQIDICPFCKDDPKVFATISPLYGIEQLAQDTGLSEEEYHTLRSLRNKVFHSIAALRVTRKQEEMPLVESIRNKVPIARNLLIDGLGRTLKLSKDTVQQIKEHEPLKESQTMRLRLKTCIEDVPPTSISETGYPIHPSIEVISHELKKVEPSGNGRLTDSTWSISLRLVNCRIPENTAIETEIWGNVPTITGAGNLSFDVQRHGK
jgi:hypothetical protein